MNHREKREAISEAIDWLYEQDDLADEEAFYAEEGDWWHHATWEYVNGERVWTEQCYCAGRIHARFDPERGHFHGILEGGKEREPVTYKDPEYKDLSDNEIIEMIRAHQGESFNELAKALRETIEPCPRCGKGGACATCSFSGIKASQVVYDYYHAAWMRSGESLEVSFIMGVSSDVNTIDGVEV